MKREDSKKLNINRRIIVNHLIDLEGVLDYLIAKQVITPAIREKIIHHQSAGRSPCDRIRNTLDYLIKNSNSQAYQYFLESLILTGNTVIANILEPEYSASEECKNLIERERITTYNIINNNENCLPYPVACSQAEPSHLYRNSSCTPPQMHHSGIARARSNSVAAIMNLMNSRGAFDREDSPVSPSTSRTAFEMERSFMLSSPLTGFYLQQQFENPTYNIDWCDVNDLQLDFEVFTTYPNIRKQLSPDECYQMEQNPRGLCLIINNEYFYDDDLNEKKDMRRFGTTLDASRLKRLFEKLHFEVELFNNLNSMDMRQAIQAFAYKSEQNTDIYDAICLILLSHGTDGYIYGTDLNNKINLDKEILNMFDDVLIGKPKLFIFQACRGDTINKKDLSSYSASSEAMSSMSIYNTGACSSSSLQESQYISNTHQVTIKNKLIETNTTKNIVDEDTLGRKFRQLKMSTTTPSNLQLMYKKKSSSNTAPSNSTASITNHVSTGVNQSNNKVNKKTRSRSHSRSKYSSYFASAASALRTVIRTSPNTSKAQLTSISTQTCQSGCSSSSSISSSSVSTSSIPVSGYNNYSENECPSPTFNNYSNSIIGSGPYLLNTQSLSNFIDGHPIKTALPSRSDFFIWYSSVRGLVSHREQDGSPFIKCLITVFSKCSHELELIEMVRKVNMLMQKYEKRHFDGRNAVACYLMGPVAEYHLAKRLYFNP